MAAVKFFLGHDAVGDDDSDSEDDEPAKVSILLSLEQGKSF